MGMVQAAVNFVASNTRCPPITFAYFCLLE